MEAAIVQRTVSGLLVRSFPALLTPAVIVGGIFSGWFSPTEAAAVTVDYAILIDLIFYRELTLRRLWDAIYQTTTTSASIAMIIAGVSLLGYVLAREQAPQQIASLFLSISDGPVSFLIAVNLMVFALGMFIESLVILLIVVPILVPIALGFDIDPIHFGIIIVLNLKISILTPPIGMALFIVAQVGDTPYQKLAKAILPWLLPPIIVLFLVCFFPVLATGLRSLMQ
ncbi:TRAP transporter large permease [Nitratireductor sp. CH_MIT9313-5]|uniref:TRAP transporter large permease n=1 Tax=Nitratireductor sp. CH_MIT9313-5 TaxID=3107764 RepID=UPI00300AC664